MRALKSLLFGLFWLILAVAIGIFAASNPDAVYLRFWPLEARFAVAPWVVLMAGMALGVLLAAVISGWYRLKAFVRTRQTDRQNKRLTAANLSLNEEAGTLRAAAKHEAQLSHQQMLDKSS